MKRKNHATSKPQARKFNQRYGKRTALTYARSHSQVHLIEAAREIAVQVKPVPTLKGMLKRMDDPRYADERSRYVGVCNELKQCRVDLDNLTAELESDAKERARLRKAEAAIPTDLRHHIPHPSGTGIVKPAAWELVQAQRIRRMKQALKQRIARLEARKLAMEKHAAGLIADAILTEDSAYAPRRKRYARSAAHVPALFGPNRPADPPADPLARPLGYTVYGKGGRGWIEPAERPPHHRLHPAPQFDTELIEANDRLHQMQAQHSRA